MNADEDHVEVDGGGGLNGDLPRIQDLEHYLQRNGLYHNDDVADLESTVDQRELAARIEREERYKAQMLSKFLEKDDKEESEALKDEKQELSRQRKSLLDTCSGRTFSIRVTSSSSSSSSSKQDVIKNVPLYHFVEKCDTIYTLVKSNQWSTAIQRDGGSNDSRENKVDESPDLIFSLEEFDTLSIQEFIAVVQDKKGVQDITPAECIVECCRIAHFLQASSILEDIVNIIKESIDTENCASICILADQLELPSLLHCSMEYVMDRLDNIQANDIWDDFPQSLRHHVITLRNAAHSSIIRRGRQTKVVFASSNEFLGIFFDTLREHKERLQEAKIRQEEIIQERIHLNQQRGRYTKEIDIYGGSVKDAAIKIEKQEKRVQTLECFYQEQKAIFSKDFTSDGSFKSSFTL